jgi:hypothetical protein
MVVLHLLDICLAVLLIVVVLWDAFETMVLPRRIARRFRLASGYTRGTWRVWAAIARHIRSIGRREAFLAVFGPLALLALLVVWVLLLILGFALLQWGLGSHLSDVSGRVSFGTDIYFSGTTLLTLGLGDVIPHSGPERIVTVVEVGVGFGMLALVIGYLPVLYQAFSLREVRISLLDAHAGSPPTAGALIHRHPPNRRAKRLAAVFAEWERWSAELLESHLSFPLLAFYRSQHEEQSWVAGLTMILDACVLILACAKEQALDADLTEQAAFTFAMARHACADLAQSFGVSSRTLRVPERITAADRARLTEALLKLGLVSDREMADAVEQELDTLRRLYEVHMAGLGMTLLMDLPPWMPSPGALDDWQTTADDLTAPPIGALKTRAGRPASLRQREAPSPGEVADARLDR